MRQALDFLQSEIRGVVRTVRPYQIHGARFYELGLALEGDPPDTVRRVRVSDNLAYRDPQPGDAVRVAFVMGNVLRIAKDAGGVGS
ncbi:MAG: hypothetical protein Kow00109_27600 [Acidobacteriota bacterium]